MGSRVRSARAAGYAVLALLNSLLGLLAFLWGGQLTVEEPARYTAPILLAVAAGVATLLALRTRSRAEAAEVHPSRDSHVEVPSRNLRAIVSVAQMAGVGRDVSAVLQQTLDKALEITGLKAGAIYFPAEPSGRPIANVYRGPKGHENPLASFPFREELVDLVIESGQPVVSDGRSSTAAGETSLEARSGFSWAIVPIPCERVRGALCVAESWRGGLPEGSLGSLVALGQVAGGVLDTVRMLEENSRDFHEMAVLHKVSLEITSKLDPGTVVKSLVERATELIGGVCGAVYLAGDGSNDPTRVAGVLSGEYPWDEVIRICDWLASLVLGKGISTIVSGAHLLDGAAVQWSADKPTPGAVCAPLPWQGETKGAVLVLVEESTDRPSTDDLQLLTLLANQAAIALQNSRLYSQANQLFVESIGALSDAIEIRDAYTAGHSQQIALYCLAMAQELGLSEEEQEVLHFAALLHDIGKIGVSDAILRKPGKLTAQELAEMRRHCAIGARVARRIEKLRPVVPIIYHHHERYDGTGYPEGLGGEGIPLLARVLAVADSLGAMTSDRPYRPALSMDRALDEIRRNSGNQFDPNVVQALMRALGGGETPALALVSPTLESQGASEAVTHAERRDEVMHVRRDAR